MESTLLHLLIGVVVVLLLLVAIRIARERHLGRVTLAPEAIRSRQVELTDWARRCSIQPGMEVDLWTFFRSSGIREPDRRAIIDPLLEEQIFGWYIRRSNDTFEEFLNTLGRLVWNPTRRKVLVSQWVRDEAASGRATTVIVHNALGDVVTGTKVGRDHIGGDRIGGDKIGGHRSSGSSHLVASGGGMSHSGNAGHATGATMTLGNPNELGAALFALAERAESVNEREGIVRAIRWASEAARLDEVDVDVRASTRAVREISAAPGWIKAALTSMVAGASGSLIDHWLLEVLSPA